MKKWLVVVGVMAVMNLHGRVSVLVDEKKQAVLDAVVPVGEKKQAVLDAVVSVDEKIVQAYLEAGGEINKQWGEENMTLLHIAAESGQSEIAHFLLTQGAEVNAKTDEGYGAHGVGTPLHYAARTGNLDMVDLLLNYGADPNSKHGQKSFRAGWVPRRARNSIYMWWTPLHWAAHEGHVEVVKRLLQAGANPRKKNLSGITPIDLAQQQGYQQVLDLF